MHARIYTDNNRAKNASAGGRAFPGHTGKDGMATSIGRLRTRVPRRENWTEYVGRVTKGVPRKIIAEVTGIDPSGLSRWSSGHQPSAEKVVSFARGLGQPPIEALIAAGYLEPQEAAGAIEVMRSREDLSDSELLIELGNRLAERPSRRQVNDITLARPEDAGNDI